LNKNIGYYVKQWRIKHTFNIKEVLKITRGGGEMTIFKKRLSIIVLSLFLFSILPIKAMADNVSNGYVEPQHGSSETKEKKEDSKIIREVVEKRERAIKHFLKQDNSFEAVIYPYSVHYNNDGKWEDIDNSLVESTDEDNNNVLENKNNSYKVKFGNKIDSNKLVSIKKDKYEIYWNVINDLIQSEANESTDKKEETKFYDNLNKNSEIKIIEKGLDKLKNLSENEKKITLTKVDSKVIFKNIYNNVDLTYDVEPDKFKETIISNEKTNNFEFRFNLYAKN